MSEVMKVLQGKAAPVSSSSNGIYATFVGPKSGLHMKMLGTKSDKWKFSARELLMEVEQHSITSYSVLAICTTWDDIHTAYPRYNNIITEK